MKNLEKRKDPISSIGDAIFDVLNKKYFEFVLNNSAEYIEAELLKLPKEQREKAIEKMEAIISKLKS